MDRWAWLLCAVFLAAILFLNWTCPFSSDDCAIGLSYQAQGHGLPRHLATFAEAWAENWRDGYRPIVSLFVRIFTGCLGKWAFNLSNTAMMLGLIVCLLRLSRRRFNFRTMALILTLVFLVLCKGESYLWCTGSVNYLWAGTGSLLFCIILEGLDLNGAKWPEVVAYCVFALFAGWSQEAFSLPVFAAMCALHLLRKGPVSPGKLAVGTSYMIGLVLLVGVAGRRVSTIPAFSPSELVMTLIKIAVAIKGVWLLLLLVMTTKEKLPLIKRNMFYLLVICANVCMIAVVGFNGERCLWAANLFAIVVIAREFRPSGFLARAMSVALVPTLCVCCILGSRIKGEFDGFTRQYLESSSAPCRHNRVQCGPFARFLYQFVYSWSDGFHGRCFAFYHGRDVAPLAFSSADYEALLSNEFCVPSNRLRIAAEAYTTRSSNTIVVPLPDNAPAPARARVEYDFPRGFCARLRREIDIRRTPPVANPDIPRTVTINGRRLALVGKFPNGDAYIKGITLE